MCVSIMLSYPVPERALPYRNGRCVVSIHLDRAVYSSHKRVRCQEADRASKESIDQTCEKAVCEEQQCADQSADV